MITRPRLARLGLAVGLGIVTAMSGLGNVRAQVCIDIGHGGVDPGTVTFIAEYSEADINLDVGLKLKGIFEDSVGTVGSAVIFTRVTDTAINLIERPDIANAADACAFISIHDNASSNPLTKQGCETFYNTAATVGDTNTCSGDFSGHTRDISSGLALKIVERLHDDFGSFRDTFNNRGRKLSSFLVLRCSKMVSVVSEASFINAPHFNSEAQLFLQDTDNHQSKEALALFNGWMSYVEGNGIGLIDYAYAGWTSNDDPIVLVDGHERTVPDSTCWRENETHLLEAPPLLYLPNTDGPDLPDALLYRSVIDQVAGNLT